MYITSQTKSSNKIYLKNLEGEGEWYIFQEGLLNNPHGNRYFWSTARCTPLRILPHLILLGYLFILAPP